jgi:hypothetical protein
LLRGELTLSVADKITVTGAGLGPGTIEVLVEDDRGVRTSAGSITTQGSGPAAALGQIATPSAGTRVVAVFRGNDAAGEPVVAVGAMPLTH